MNYAYPWLQERAEVYVGLTPTKNPSDPSLALTETSPGMKHISGSGPTAV